MATSKKAVAPTPPVPSPAPAPAVDAPKAAPQLPATAIAAAAAKKKPVRQPKPLDPKVQAAKEALAGALAKAKAAKITKPLGKPAKAAKPPRPAPAAKPAKPEKTKKVKMVRDSFTMPEPEYAQIAALKKRLQGQKVAAKKSELLRAGIALLAGLKDVDLVKAVDQVEKIKTGRPAKSGK